MRVIEFTVLSCNFKSNSALNGGGLYWSSPEPFTEENFTIADNRFEGNKARTSDGIVLGVAFRETNRVHYLKRRVLTEFVIIRRNTFVQNRSVCGGGLYLAPGELSHFAS